MRDTSSTTTIVSKNYTRDHHGNHSRRPRWEKIVTNGAGATGEFFDSVGVPAAQAAAVPTR